MCHSLLVRRDVAAQSALYTVFISKEEPPGSRVTDAFRFIYSFTVCMQILHNHYIQPQGRFSLILHASPNIVVFFNQGCFFFHHCIILLDVTYFVICQCGVLVLMPHGVVSSCLLCLQVWHSTFAVYHKNAIKIIIESTCPQNRSHVAFLVECQSCRGSTKTTTKKDHFCARISNCDGRMWSFCAEITRQTVFTWFGSSTSCKPISLPDFQPITTVQGSQCARPHEGIVEWFLSGLSCKSSTDWND